MAKDIDFTDDIDDKGEVEAVRQAEREEPTKDPVVDLDKIDQEEEDKASRKEGRTSRYWRNKEDADRDRERIAALERREQELLNQQALWLQQQQQSFQSRQEPQKDPIDEDVDFLMRKADLIRSEYQNTAQRYGGRVPPEVHERMERELKQVELQVVDKRAEKILRDRMPQQQGNPQAAAIRAHVEMNYPDVHRNPNAIQYAQHWEMLEIHKGNRPTLDQVMDAARRQFRTGPYAPGAPRPRPEHLSDRYAGVPRGASGGGNGESRRTVVMTKDMQKMAAARYPNELDPKVRNAKFAKMLEEEEGRG